MTAPLRVLILGAGFGGLELSTRLSEEAAGDIEVTLIDQSDAFVFGFSKLDVMFGRRSADEVRHPPVPRRGEAGRDLPSRSTSPRSTPSASGS